MIDTYLITYLNKNLKNIWTENESFCVYNTIKSYKNISNKKKKNKRTFKFYKKKIIYIFKN
jgi:hypothetical protein